jgi:hypothetical protein
LRLSTTGVVEPRREERPVSWTDHHRRRKALDTVLARAAADPAAPLTAAGPDGADVSDVFADAEELLLALHYKWMQQLTGRVGVALAEAERAPDGDRADAVGRAWLATAQAQPVLRAVLDAHLDTTRPALRAAAEREQRMVALASGMAELTEPADQTAAIGAAFITLLRSAPTHTVARRRSSRSARAEAVSAAER